MALTAQLMATMDDSHLVAALRAELDPLTSTDAERELLTRIERLLDERVDNEPLTAVLAEFEIEGSDSTALHALFESHPANLKDMAALLSLLNDEDIHEPNQLKEAIRLLKEFEAIANDVGDAVSRLSQLITTAQE